MGVRGAAISGERLTRPQTFDRDLDIDVARPFEGQAHREALPFDQSFPEIDQHDMASAGRQIGGIATPDRQTIDQLTHAKHRAVANNVVKFRAPRDGCVRGYELLVGRAGIDDPEIDRAGSGISERGAGPGMFDTQVARGLGVIGGEAMRNDANADRRCGTEQQKSPYRALADIRHGVPSRWAASRRGAKNARNPTIAQPPTIAMSAVLKVGQCQPA